MQTIKLKRPRIAIGQLVASSNPVKVGCIKVLHIAHYYRPLNFKRVKQCVISVETLNE